MQPKNKSFKSKRKIKGIFALTVRKNGVVIEQYEDKNLVVNTGFQAILNLLQGSPGFNITQIGFSTGVVDPDPADTALTGTPFYQPLSDIDILTDKTIRFRAILDETENNGMNITEYGLMCDGGALFARKVREVIVKDNTITLEVNWTLIFN